MLGECQEGAPRSLRHESLRLRSLGDEVGSRNLAVQRCQNSSVAGGQLDQVPIGRLPRGLHPGWKTRDILIVGNKRKMWLGGLLDSKQKSARLVDREPVGWSLDQHPDKSQFRDRTRSQWRKLLGSHPDADPIMEFMMGETECHKSVHVEKVCHVDSGGLSRWGLWRRFTPAQIEVAQATETPPGFPLPLCC